VTAGINPADQSKERHMNREMKAIIARLSGDAQHTFIEFARAILDAGNAGQIAEILASLDDTKLADQLDSEAIEHLKKSARMTAADFRNGAR
jgi:hypothetical protein